MELQGHIAHCMHFLKGLELPQDTLVDAMASSSSDAGCSRWTRRHVGPRVAADGCGSALSIDGRSGPSDIGAAEHAVLHTDSPSHPQVDDWPAPSVAELAELAKLRLWPQPGASFLSKGGRGRPCCVEYSDMPPNGRRWGSLDGGTILTAKEVKVGLIPTDLKRRLPKEWGICIRCESHLKPGQDCWINITRAATTFVERGSGSSTERGEEERRQGKGRGEEKGAKGKGKRGGPLVLQSRG